MNGAPTRYVLDTSVFTQAARSYYSFAIAPRFWDALTQHARTGAVLSIDRVKGEIDNGKDELKEWANNNFHYSFETTNDDKVLTAYQQVIQWAMGQSQYTNSAKAEFAREDNADAWVVAYAMAKSCLVVTQEQPAPGAKARIMLPNVCQAFGIPFIDTFEMMRKLGIKL
jgi:hypothetical protein